MDCYDTSEEASIMGRNLGNEDSISRSDFEAARCRFRIRFWIVLCVVFLIGLTLLLTFLLRDKAPPPTIPPSARPSRMQSLNPSITHSSEPSFEPSILPTCKYQSIYIYFKCTYRQRCSLYSLMIALPSRLPSLTPTASPTVIPSITPSETPTLRPSLMPSELPTILQNSSRFVDIVNLLSPILGSEKFNIHKWTPQNEAAKWMAEIDGLALSLNNTLLVQRFVMVTLYFALAGDGWIFSANFLSSESECTWFQEFLVSGRGERRVGLTCHDDGLIHSISLRKSAILCEVAVKNNYFQQPRLSHFFFIHTCFSRK